MKKRHISYGVLLCIAALLASAWLARARLAGEIARAYFAQHGIESALDISALDFSGLSGRFTLGPVAAPDLAADHIQLIFDPLRLKPRVVEVRLVHPLIRARVDANGKVTLGSLQAWIDDLQSRQGQSDYVSDNLAVALDGMELQLATPGGAFLVDGDVRLVKNFPVRAALRLKPARISYNGISADFTAARLDYDQAKKSLMARFSGTLKTGNVAAQTFDASLDASALRWTAAPLAVTASDLHIHAIAASLNAGASIAQPVIDITAQNAALRGDSGPLKLTAATLHVQAQASSLASSVIDNSVIDKPRIDITARDAALTGGTWNGRADVTVTAQGGSHAPLNAVKAIDPALAAALARNLSHGTLAFAGHVEGDAAAGRFKLISPLTVTGADKAALRVATLAAQWTQATGAPLKLGLSTDVALAGPGLPTVKLALRDASWTDGDATANIALLTQFSLASLKGVDLTASGRFSSQAGHYRFTPDGCARLTLAAFHPGASEQSSDLSSDLASHVQTGLCGARIEADASGWTFTADTHDASAELPLVGAHIEGAVAHLSFRGKGAPQSGDATIITAIIGDRATTPRYKPVTVSGTASLADQQWNGRLAIANAKQTALAAVTFHHALANATGQAHIDAPKLTFAPGAFQPADILPLLAPLRQANGVAAFSGDLGWTADTLTSSGKLSLAGLDFLTPLGPAHTIKTELALDSLLPPSATPGQHIAIARIDWTLPLTAMSLVLGFTPQSLTIASADTGIAQGNASLDPLSINLADLTHIAGTVHLNHIALEDLIAASNLADKIKLVGKVSGTVPFILSPEGLHITNGHVTADGLGRLEVNRALWTQGAAVAANAVQDFAYQALEHMAFDQLSADLNSVAGGRLQVVFHVKGHSDPPQAQKAEVTITDLINGTALQKPIALPSNTPIDLTLDTSLNFDELLKSYSEAWSKTLVGTGAPQ